jgi:hypothetical protein
MSLIETQETDTQVPVNEIAHLLKISQDTSYDESEDILHVKEDFEKLGSFFDLIKQDSSTNVVDAAESEVITGQNPLVTEDVTEIDTDAVNAPELDEQIAEYESAPGDILTEEASEGDGQSSHVENNTTDADSDDFVIDPIIGANTEETNDIPKQSVGEKVSDELLKIEYEKGYSDAVRQLEKSLEDEKAYLSELSANLFTIKGEISEELQKLITEKIHQLSIDFLGEKIDLIPQTLLDKIMASVEHISSYLETVVVELNEFDALAINSNVTDLEDYAFKIKVNKDLKRGEFKITDGDTLYAKLHS